MNLDIVSVHLNDFQNLDSTRRSLEKAIPEWGVSWIIVDGGSISKTHCDEEVLRQSDALSTRFLSEPDKGIYDAMNKGTQLLTGDYVLYLNAGDVLNPEFSWPLLEKEINDSRPGMVWGTCHERYSDGRMVKVKNRSPGLAWYGIPVNHQNVLFRRDLLGTGPYDEDLRYCADYELIGRLLKQGSRVHRTEMPIAIFQRGGASARNFRETMREEEMLRTRHFGVNPVLSRLITHVKIFNRKAGQIPAVRRLMRKWV